MFENCRYVFAGTTKPIPADKIPGAWVEVGGDPDNVQGDWVYAVRADKRPGFLSGYSIMESTSYPDRFEEVGRALTPSGARKIINNRTLSFAEEFARKYDLPLVDFEERQRLRDGADANAVARILGTY